MNDNVLFKRGDWELSVKVSSKGNPFIGAFYKGIFMGFVTIGDSKTTNLMLSLEFKDFIESNKRS